MSDVAMLGVVIGFLSPPVLAVIQQTPWKPAYKAIVTFLWAILVGALSTYVAGEWSGRNVVSVMLLILVVAVASYQDWWKNFTWMQALERATSYHPKSGPLR